MTERPGRTGDGDRADRTGDGHAGDSPTANHTGDSPSTSHTGDSPSTSHTGDGPSTSRTGDRPSTSRTGDRPPPTLPWTTWQPGDRVVVRYRTADGLHDALGELLSTAPDGVLVRTRRGDVRVHARDMVTGKRVPPPPQRPPTPPG